MPKLAEFSHQGDSVTYAPVTAVEDSQPVEIATGFWGIPFSAVAAGEEATFRTKGIFFGYKINSADAFSVGDLLDFTAGMGFAAGSTWRVVKDSPTGEQYVEVEINSVDSSGSSPSTGASVTVVASGNDITDDTALDAATAAINTAGGGSLLLDGIVSYTSDKSVTVPIVIKSVDGKLGGLNQSGNPRFIIDNLEVHPFLATGADPEYATIPIATVERQEHITVPTGHLAVGDYFSVLSDDAVVNPGTSQSASFDEVRTIETHQVKEIRGSSGGNDYIVFDDYIRDPLVTAPRCVRLDGVIDGVKVQGIIFSHTGGNATNAVMEFRGCTNVDVDKCTWKAPAPNEVQFRYCMNWRVTNNTFEPNQAYDTSDGYGVVAMASNKGLVTGNTCGGYRHLYTSGSAGNTGTILYGMNRNTVISNNVLNGVGTTSGSLAVLDTHCNDVGTSFINNHISVPSEFQDPVAGSGTNVNQAIKIRSREAVIQGNVITGGGRGIGCDILAPGCIVKNNTFNEGIFIGVRVRAITDTIGVVDGLQCDNNTFIGCSSEAVELQSDGNHVISRNTVIESGSTTGFLLQCRSSVTNGVIISGNQLDKGTTNTDAFDIDPTLTPDDVMICDNSLRGYAGGSYGFDLSVANSPDFVRRYAKDNNDKQAPSYITTTNALNFVSDIGKPIKFDGTIYDDTTTDYPGVRGILIGGQGDTIALATFGQKIEIPSAMIGATIPEGSEDLYWDASAATYNPTNNGDAGNGVALRQDYDDGTIAYCTVRLL